MTIKHRVLHLLPRVAVCSGFGVGVGLNASLMVMTNLLHYSNIAIAQEQCSGPGCSSTLVQQGLDRYQAGDFRGAIEVWQAAMKSDDRADQVTVLKYLVRAYQQVGQEEPAIAQLNRLIAHYRKVGDLTQVGRLLTEQAQLYTSLGQQRRAIVLLCGNQIAPNCDSNSALAIARHQADRLGEAAALGSLGTVYRLRGEYEASLQSLQTGLAIAQTLDHPTYVISATSGLGNTYASLARQDYRRAQFATQAGDRTAAERFTQQGVEHDRQAVALLQQGLQLARQQGDLLNQLRILLNLSASYQRSREFQTDATTLQQALHLLNQLPDSRDKAYAAIQLGDRWLTRLNPDLSQEGGSQCVQSTPIEVSTLLTQAATIAQRIGDSQTQAFALGRLGRLYECQQNLNGALQLTQQAQVIAETQASQYLWEWQLGRILKAQGKIYEAIAAYESAVRTLKDLRGAFAIASRDVQFDFRDTVEPVYRELTELYLERASSEGQKTKGEGDSQATNPQSQGGQRWVNAALETIDALRLVELQNYLGSDCAVEVVTRPVTLVDAKTAVFNSVMVGDRVAVILTLPRTHQGSGQRAQSRVHWLPSSRQNVTETINQLRLQMEKRSDRTNTYQKASQQVYDWLIRPFAAELEQSQIETLVFIQDGILRSVPMAVLHDGQQFLVERYAIANTLSLTLVDPTRLNSKDLRVLAFGLTQPSVVQGPTFFEPLSFVKSEVTTIQTILPGSKGFLDEAFSRDRLQQELAQTIYPIVHLATHGRFGFDARETFLVTGQKDTQVVQVQGMVDKPQPYNEKLTLNQFYQILRDSRRNQALELLILTACETAVGSDRDALGIAGISLQAGARSAVASLWQVDDQSTAQLINQFYQNLRQGMGRAKALQLAQKSWLQQNPDVRNHPGYWAALILVGNWL